ncbi:MAG: hypothetical protein KAJ14_16615 [Candidatus Omnitrophica bacterium]|nr:hypothetical protein [Nanoarchaeota archaeon]MCK5494734.1 hypothetical protein [Candidatus Omnitrophota bacterium]
MKIKMGAEKVRWILIAVSVSVVLILCECCLSNCPINNWNTSRWITAAIIIAVFVLAALFGWGGKNED